MSILLEHSWFLYQIVSILLEHYHVDLITAQFDTITTYRFSNLLQHGVDASGGTPKNSTESTKSLEN